MPSTPARRSATREAKLQAILDAALAVFAEKGFAEARLEDVAARAGVAKGTVYLYVSSKQELFERLVTAGIRAPLESVTAHVVALDAPLETKLRTVFAFLRREVLETHRRDIIRLLITEAGRFPDIAEFYHREIVSRGIALLRGLAAKAAERGEIASDEIVRFPHLVIAPMLVAVLWSFLFARFDPLDVEGMIDAHVTLLTRALKGPAS